MPRGPAVFDAATQSHKIAASIADVATGAGDIELRPVINSVLAVLRSAGVVAGAGNRSTPALDPEDYTYVLGGNIANATGGAAPDANSRTAMGSIITALRSAGLIPRATGVARPQPVYDPSDQTNVQGAAIANVSGGTGADATARTAINSILAALRNAGVIAN